MDSISSSEFRRRYASLLEPTVVTAGGRPIGQWMPVGYAITVTAADGALTIDPPPMRGQTVQFSTRPFTPVPKKGK